MGAKSSHFVSEWLSLGVPLRPLRALWIPLGPLGPSLPFEITFHSKWLRNNPQRAPWAHSPPRAPKAPLGTIGTLWVPLGPFGSPWVPLGPFGWDPWGWGPWGAFGSQGSRSSRGDKIASQSLAGGATIAGETILGRRHARKRSGIY